MVDLATEAGAAGLIEGSMKLRSGVLGIGLNIGLFTQDAEHLATRAWKLWHTLQ